MGRTWKFTEQIYEELKENVDKKLETHFDTGLMGNPFEKYAWEIDYGIAKMNEYVERVNEADGFNRAKLDRVFQQIADTDKKYGNQIKKCTEDLKHYNNVLYQLEVVMEQALTGSSNGNAGFDFDREAFQALVKDDKNAMDIAYVDRILSQDVGEISAEEYAQIAVMIGNQPTGDTALVEYILNRTDMWEFVDVNLLPGGDGISDGVISQLSNGVLMPSEKYSMLLVALEEYAKVLSINQPQEGCLENYIRIRDTVFCCTELFATLAVNADKNTWGYMYGTGQESDMLEFCLNEGMFRLEAREEDEWIIKIRMEGNTEAELKVVGACSGTYANNHLIALEHEYINAYLGLDNTIAQVISQSVAGSIWNKVNGDAFAEAVQGVFGSTIAPYVTTMVDMTNGVIDDVNEHNETVDKITEYEKWGNYTSTIEFADLNCSIANFTTDYGVESHATVTFYPGNETVERLYLLNALLASDVGREKMKQEILAQVPSGGFTAEYIVQNMEEADILLKSIEESLKRKGYADTLVEAVEKYKAEMIGEGEWSHE